MKKRNNTGVVSSIIITVALLAILSIITWVIPMPRNTSPIFITVYICAMVFIAAEGFLTVAVFFADNYSTKKILGLPIVYFGMMGVIAQLVATAIFYLVNAFVVVPVWIVVVVECLIYLITIVHLVFAFFFKKRTEEFKTNKTQTKYMDFLRAKLETVLIANENKDLRKPLEELLMSAKATDPVSNDLTKDIEIKIDDAVDAMIQLTEEGAANESIINAISKIETLIKQRSVYCKLGK